MQITEIEILCKIISKDEIIDSTYFNYNHNLCNKNKLLISINITTMLRVSPQSESIFAIKSCKNMDRVKTVLVM